MAANSHMADYLFSKKENAFLYDISEWPANTWPEISNDCKGNITNIDKEKILSTHKTYGIGSWSVNNTIYRINI